MNARAEVRRGDVALARAWARCVFAGADRIGRVHPTECGWVAECADGQIVGTYPGERQAVDAILVAWRRGR